MSRGAATMVANPTCLRGPSNEHPPLRLSSPARSHFYQCFLLQKGLIDFVRKLRCHRERARVRTRPGFGFRSSRNLMATFGKKSHFAPSIPAAAPEPATHSVERIFSGTPSWKRIPHDPLGEHSISPLLPYTVSYRRATRYTKGRLLTSTSP